MDPEAYCNLPGEVITVIFKAEGEEYEPFRKSLKINWLQGTFFPGNQPGNLKIAIWRAKNGTEGSQRNKGKNLPEISQK